MINTIIKKMVMKKIKYSTVNKLEKTYSKEI